MKKLLVILFITIGCSNINTESKDYYKSSKGSHGLKTTDKPFKPTIKVKSTSELIAFGKVVYTQNCQSCHGVKGEGDGPLADQQQFKPTNLNQAVNEVEHFAFYTRYSYWDGKMPGWNREFSPREIDALTAYLYQFKKK